MQQFKFEIITTAGTYELTENPMGWDKFGIILQRNETYHGVFGSISTNLRFSRYQSGFGGDYILTEFETNGINGDLTLNISRLNDDLSTYTTFFTGKGDYSPSRFSYTFDYVDISFKQNSNEISLIANDSIDYYFAAEDDTVTFIGIPFLVESSFTANLNNTVNTVLGDTVESVTKSINDVQFFGGDGDTEGGLTINYESPEMTVSDLGIYNIRWYFGFNLLATFDTGFPLSSEQWTITTTTGVLKYNGSTWDIYNSWTSQSNGSYSNPLNEGETISDTNYIQLNDETILAGTKFKIVRDVFVTWQNLDPSCSPLQINFTETSGLVVRNQASNGGDKGTMDIDFTNIVSLQNQNTSLIPFATGNNKIIQNDNTAASIVINAPQLNFTEYFTFNKYQSSEDYSVNYYAYPVVNIYNANDELQAGSPHYWNTSSGTITNGTSLTTNDYGESAIIDIPASGYARFFWRIDFYEAVNIIDITNSNTLNNTTLSINVTATSKSVGDTTEKCIKLTDLFDGLISKTTGQSLLASDFTSTLESHVITSGQILRRINDFNSVKANLRNAFNSINSKFNLCLKPASNGFYIDNKANAYKNTLIYDIGEVSNLIIKPHPMYFNSISVGQNSFTYKFSQGVNEFMKKHQYSLPYTVKNELNLISPYNWDSIGIEFARRNNINLNSEDTAMDDKNYIVEKSGVYALQCTGYTGFPYILLYYNPNTSNYKCLVNWNNYLRSFINGTITFQSTDANFTAVNDLSISDLSSFTTSGTALFEPLIYEFDGLFTIELLEALNNEKHGYIQFTNMGTTYKGFIDSVDASEYEGKLKMTLIKTPF